MSNHKLTYRGIELPIPEEHDSYSNITISRAYLEGIDVVLDQREALEAGYEKLAQPEYEWYRDERDPEWEENYYYRVNTKDHSDRTVVRGKNANRVKGVRSYIELNEDFTLTPESQVPDWAKVD